MADTKVHGFNECPCCGGHNLEAFSIYRSENGLELSMECVDCGTHIWDDYDLTGRTWCENDD